MIPQEIRDKLGLKAGSALEFTVAQGHVVMRVASRFPRVSIDEVAGKLKYDGPPISIEEMDEGIAQMFREQAKRANGDRAV